MNLQEVIDKNLVFKLSEAPSSLLLEIQQCLSRQGLYPKDKIDGIYGNLTKAGWSTFKSKHHQGSPELIGAGSAQLLLDRSQITNQPKGSLAQRIVQVCNARDYFLDRREGAINLIGIEGMDESGKKIADNPDGWNDIVAILIFEDGNPKILCTYQATTEPGIFYTLNPLNRGGAARLQVGQHKGLWSFGLHRGYEALVQVGPATLVRDKNRNYMRDDKQTVERGNGINLHSTKPGYLPNIVGKFSAGCVVIRSWNHFLRLKNHIKNSLQYKQNKNHRFDFTLLWRDWL